MQSSVYDSNFFLGGRIFQGREFFKVGELPSENFSYGDLSEDSFLRGQFSWKVKILRENYSGDNYQGGDPPGNFFSWSGLYNYRKTKKFMYFKFLKATSLVFILTPVFGLQ